MKQRFSSLDVKVIAHELSELLCSLRLSNAYDLSSRIFLFKFAKPNFRQQLVIESGFRCHLTKFARATAAEPSAFVTRLRKFLRTRRVTGVSQVGTDRVIEITFSDGQYRLFLEFYAGGNVILTNAELKILAILRTVPPAEKQEELRVGLQYVLENRQNFSGVPELTGKRIQQALQKAHEKAVGDVDRTKKGKKKPGDLLRKALSTSLNELPPTLIDHAISSNSFDSGLSIEQVLNDHGTQEKLLAALRDAEDVVKRVISEGDLKGYIIARPAKSRQNDDKVGSPSPEVDKENIAMIYEEFHPFLPHQFVNHPDIQTLEFTGFNATVDEFFSSLESQKLETRVTEREQHARRRLEAARTDHEKRVLGLQQVQELNVRKAQAIESNIQRIEEATAAVNGLIAQGMDWEEIAQLIQMEKARQNPVAHIIQLPLKLETNTITLLLAEQDFEDEEDYEGDTTDSDASDSEDEVPAKDNPRAVSSRDDKRLNIDIDLALTPWANAREYYDQKKTAAVKEAKTLGSSEKAIKSAEQKVLASLKKDLKQEQEGLRPLRRQLWFEKFYYFITSEGYLVLGGRDNQQIDLLYSRYLQKGDVFVHADVKEAVPFIVKNRPGLANQKIPPNSLAQAGTLSIATSTAWDSKAVMAAWWVNYDQVKKIDPTGQYLEAGSFLITGEKTFLPPAQLLLGIGMMFRVSADSKARHLKHRIEHNPEAEMLDITAEAPDITGSGDDESQDPKLHEAVDDEVDEQLQETDDVVEPRDPEEDSDEEPEPQRRNPLQPLEGQMGGLSLEKEAQASEEESEEEIQDIEGHEEGSILQDVIEPEKNESADDMNPSQALKPKQAPAVRGKRGKKAKIKAKYADQDEEERALAMQLLGSGTPQQQKKTALETRAAKEAELQAQKERRRQQHTRLEQKNKEADEARRQQIESGGDIMTPEEIAELKLVENFVGTPLPGDEILDCMVVCGPWDALGPKLRWRIKMQPGTVKRGKAIKEVLSVWNKEAADREKKRLPPAEDPSHEEERTLRKQGEFIKSIKDVEVIGCIPVGKVRLFTSGGSSNKAGAGTDKGKGGRGGGKQGKNSRGGKGSKKSR